MRDALEPLWAHDRREQLAVVNARTLVVASSTKSALVLLEYDVLELAVENPTEPERPYAAGLRYEFVHVVVPEILHLLVHGVPPAFSVGSGHRLVHISGISRESCIPPGKPAEEGVLLRLEQSWHHHPLHCA